ncbi:MAG: radical SAM family heme chaperone HemW [Bacilli bacterium]|nr:radical SAM family heme chaperone HemW [Bacilli bacterium]
MSIYIHIPFCNSICTYCDFCKIFYNKKYINDYLNNLEQEIKVRYKSEIVNTIFIGGGTPSSLDDEELIRLMNIIEIFKLNDNYEFTVECNIESITENKLKIMKKYGVNRISIGVESFDNSIIKLLGRNHTKKDVYNKMEIVKRYFSNINIDLIYAAYDDINILKSDIDCFLKLDIPHISTYSLIIEDNTMLKINGMKNIDEDIDYEMYKYIEDTLEKNNYIHYEISNYAKNGYQSKHNLVYWNNEEYYGFGLSSTSYINNERITNTKNLRKYLNGEYLDTSVYEDKDIRMENEIMLGLRKLDGIDLDRFKDKFNVSLEDIYNIDNLISDGYLVKEDNYIKINKKYMYISNEIIVRILE